MAMFQMLSEMVGTIELLRIVALSKLVHCCKMLESAVPVWLWEIRELFTTVPANVVGRPRARLG